MTGVQTCALPIFAIASLVPEDELNEDNIMPEAFDPRVADVVSAAVKAHIAD